MFQAGFWSAAQWLEPICYTAQKLGDFGPRVKKSGVALGLGQVAFLALLEQVVLVFTGQKFLGVPVHKPRLDLRLGHGNLFGKCRIYLVLGRFGCTPRL